MNRAKVKSLTLKRAPSHQKMKSRFGGIKQWKQETERSLELGGIWKARRSALIKEKQNFPAKRALKQETFTLFQSQRVPFVRMLKPIYSSARNVKSMPITYKILKSRGHSESISWHILSYNARFALRAWLRRDIRNMLRFSTGLRRTNALYAKRTSRKRWDYINTNRRAKKSPVCWDVSTLLADSTRILKPSSRII